MAGHSKWHNIRERKGAQDAKRGKLFTKLGRAITVAARKGGGDTEFNTSLRAAIDKAKSYNMPNDNIERAIKRGTGELEGTEITEARYEGYGPGGTAFIIDAITDNTNRTVSELRHIFSRQGGNLEGSVAWQFDQKGVILLRGKADKANEEEWTLQMIEAGVDDLQTEDGDLILLTAPDDLHQVKNKLEEMDLEPTGSGLEMIPKNTVQVSDDDAKKIEKLLDALDEHDDVNEIYHN